MAGAGAPRQLLARAGEQYAALKFGRGKPLALQPRDALYGGGVRHAEPARDIGRARLAFGRDQIGDQFGVIFQHRRRLGRTRLFESLRLRVFGRKNGGRRSMFFPHGPIHTPARRRAQSRWSTYGG